MVTSERLQEWVTSMSSSPQACRRKLLIVRRFFEHMAKLKVVRRNPVTTAMLEVMGGTKRSFRPYLFTQSQIRAILRETRQLPSTRTLPLRSEMMHTITSLMYTLGLRTGEVLKLRYNDIRMDQATIFVRETKFYKERHLPFGPKLHRCLERYLAARNATDSKEGGDELLFVGWRNRPVAAQTVRTIFRALVKRTGVTPLPGQRMPRLYDLRHAFAVHRLLRWYKEGVDVQERLVLLSTFMGHVSIYETQVYLTITASLLNEANKRFQETFGSVCNREDS
jgi:site-specific recombinase XerD